ncbi:MAG: HTH domain-containing protein [Candidatus Hodarchaeales archaeon]|jgi:DNA-binding MarR family transcriptional regulator
MENIQLPARDRIFRYLRQNRGREVPVSELASHLNLKRSTISNAIKELNLQNLIKIERRPLKRGRYTVVYLIEDLIKEPYVHKNEILKEEKEAEEKKRVEKTPPLGLDTVEEMIKYLKSSNYNADEFLERVESMFPESTPFITDFVTPLMHEVGVQWAHVNLSTAEEHVISNRIEQLIIARIAANDEKEERGLIILVPVEGERHVISLLSFEYILRDLNYKTINLGRALPIQSLIQYIKDLPDLPNWIIMSITLPAYLGTIKRNLEYLHRNFKNQIRIAIGGQGISEHERNLFPEADVIAIDKEDLIKFIERLE